MAPEAVRGRIVLVPQETVIFGTTARENIGYGRPGASQEEIEAAIEEARALGDRFVSTAALCLALFMGPPEVAAIMGGDLLDDPGQEEGFRALCALDRDKPFECVGEAGESRAALDALSRDPDWRDRAVVQLLSPELKGVDVPAMKDLLEEIARALVAFRENGREAQRLEAEQKRQAQEQEADKARRKLGWEPRTGASVRLREGFLAGPDDRRLADLQGAFDDPAIDAVCTR